jgi:HEAT repeat protein
MSKDMTERSERLRAAILAGHTSDAVTARRLLADDDANVRAAALGALLRAGAITADDVARAAADPDPGVRRRAAEVIAGCPPSSRISLLALLADPDPVVVETAAWAAGELDPPDADVVEPLVRLATGHEDALVREAAVAALGAIGDARGLPAVLAATSDKPAIRRRAVIALAAFTGAEVDAALARARSDRDWQVRQAAEDLSSE